MDPSYVTQFQWHVVEKKSVPGDSAIEVRRIVFLDTNNEKIMHLDRINPHERVQGATNSNYL